MIIKTAEDEKKKHTQSLIAKIEEQKREMTLFLKKKDDINPKQGKILKQEEDFIDGDAVLEKPSQRTSSTSALEKDAIDEKNEKIAIGEIVKEKELDLDTVDQRKAPKKRLSITIP